MGWFGLTAIAVTLGATLLGIMSFARRFIKPPESVLDNFYPHLD